MATYFDNQEPRDDIIIKQQKADKNKLLADQIKMMKDQMGQMDRTVQQTRSYRR